MSTYAVDLDGTLAYYDGWKGIEHIGEPIPAMLDRVKQWLEEGHEVFIFTARCDPAAPDADLAAGYISKWLTKHLGRFIPIRGKHSAHEYWDDRAVQVEINTGRRIG